MTSFSLHCILPCYSFPLLFGWLPPSLIYTLFPYATLFRSRAGIPAGRGEARVGRRRRSPGAAERAVGVLELRRAGNASRTRSVLVQQPARRLPDLSRIRRPAHVLARADHPGSRKNAAPGRDPALGGLVE